MNYPVILETKHHPVLLTETVAALIPRSGGRYIDATLGGGGHAEALLHASSPDGMLLGLDADSEAVVRTSARLAPFGGRAVCVQTNFDQLPGVARSHGFTACDGILFDLGMSSDQLSDSARGFSFRQEAGTLDMRFDPSQGLTATDLVNRLSQHEIEEILRDYGEEPRARAIARAIVRRRPLRTTAELAAVVLSAVKSGWSRTHPATRTFMALRIAVNRELDRLSEALPQALDLLALGGRLAVISFHSLEDRTVKEFMRWEAQVCVCPPGFPVCVCKHQPRLRTISRKPVVPSAAECAGNPRARSAKLRVAERL